MLLFACLDNLFSQVNNDLSKKEMGKLPQLKNLPGKSSIILPNKLSLFNPERFKMSQAYSVFYSSGRFGGVKGLYENTINYKVSDKVEMRFNFAYLFQPGFINPRGRPSSNFNNGVFLPNFDLKYQPSQNTFIRFSYSTYSPQLMYSPYYYNSYYNPRYYNDWLWDW